MKKLLFFAACLIFSVAVFAQEGVDFRHLTFDEALTKAKAEKKLVFVDCYTSWCGPCKYMATKIFPTKEAGEFFNPRFVSVKFDMDQSEGKALKPKWGVKAYPSFFIIRPDGEIQHKLVGSSKSLDEFVERVNKGLNEKTSLFYLTQLYQKGKMSKKQLMAYREALSDAYDEENTRKIERELLAQVTEKDKLKKEFWPLLEGSAVGSPDFNLILANLSVFEKNIGKEKLDEHLFGKYNSVLGGYVSGRAKEDAVSLDDLKQQIAKLDIQKKDLLMGKIELAELVKAGDLDHLLTTLESKTETIMDGGYVWSMVLALRAAADKASKNDYNRIVVMLEKIQAVSEKEEMKDYLEQSIQYYKSLAHVGTYFEELTFEQALQRARKSGKKLLIDCYTSWCGPCKYMTEKVFPEEKLGDYLNPKFICVKFDMEKGEGPELMKKFGIRAFPTFVILNPDGTLQHKIVGGGEVDRFIARVGEAFDDNKALGVMEKKYQEGERGKVFLTQYIETLNNANMKVGAVQVARELYDSLTDEEKMSQEYWFLFKDAKLTPVDSEAYQYLLKNRGKFSQNVGKEKVEKRLSAGFLSKLGEISNGHDTRTKIQDLEVMKREVSVLELSNEKLILAQINIAQAVLSKNPNQVLAACEREMNQMKTEQFPITLVYNAGLEKAKMTPSQLNRWVKICKRLIADCEDGRYLDSLKDMLKQLETK